MARFRILSAAVVWAAPLLLAQPPENVPKLNPLDPTVLDSRAGDRFTLGPGSVTFFSLGNSDVTGGISVELTGPFSCTFAYCSGPNNTLVPVTIRNTIGNLRGLILGDGDCKRGSPSTIADRTLNCNALLDRPIYENEVNLQEYTLHVDLTYYTRSNPDIPGALTLDFHFCIPSTQSPQTCRTPDGNFTVIRALPYSGDKSLSVLAKETPPFCASGEYTYLGPTEAEVYLELLNGSAAIGTSGRRRLPRGSKQPWGGGCNDKNRWVFIKEVPMPKFSIPPLATGSDIVGKLVLRARLKESVTGADLGAVDVNYDISLGASVKFKQFVLVSPFTARDVQPEQIFLPLPSLDHGLSFSIAQAAGINLDFPTVYAVVDLDSPSPGALSYKVFALDAAGTVLAGDLHGVEGLVKAEVTQLRIRLGGKIPLGAAKVVFQPDLFLESGQSISFEPLVLGAESIGITEASPNPYKCGIKSPGDCLNRLLATPITISGLAIPAASSRRIVRVVAYSNTSAPPTETVLPNVLTANKPNEFTDTFLMPAFTSARVAYKLQGGAAVSGIFDFDGSFTPSFTIPTNASEAASAIYDFSGGSLSGLVLNTSGAITAAGKKITNYRKDLSFAGQAKNATKKLLGIDLPFAAAQPSFLEIRNTWAFDPAIPVNGGFGAKLTLSYSATDLPDHPSFVESKLQVISVGEDGTVRLYPTVIDLNAKTASAQINNLDPYYSLAMPGPFAQYESALARIGSGYALVNTGAQSAAVSANAYGAGKNTPASKPIPAAQSLRQDNTAGDQWLQVWTDSSSLVGAGWTETPFAVTPESPRDQTFLLPAVEYAKRRSTQIHIANVSPSRTIVRIDLQNSDGSLQGTYETGLEPKASLSATVESLFPKLVSDFTNGFTNGFNGYALITATQPVVASGTLVAQGHATALAAQLVTSADLTLTSRVAVRPGDATVECTLRLVNLSSSAATVTVRARNAAGANAATPATLQIPAKGQAVRELVELLGVGAGTIGSVQIESSTGGVFGELLTTDSDFLASYTVSLPLVSKFETAAVLPYATSNTSVDVYNPSNAAASVTVGAYSQTGAKLGGSTESVPAFGRLAVNTSSTGYVSISSNTPVLAAGLVRNAAGIGTGYPALPSAAPPASGGGGSTGPTPAASAAGVLNAASFGGGAISPGEIVTVFGSNIGPAALTTLKLDATGKVATSLGEARVLFDDVPGAMIYTLAGQNSVVVPYSVAGKSTTKMVMEYQGRRSDPITLNVAAAAPALFSANSSGTGPGAILNFAVAGSTVNTPQNPIDKGGIIILYGTGEGVVTPPNQDGDVVAALHTPVLGNAKVTIGGINANVLFTGSAPSLVAGVLQINVEVPANAPAGNQPVVVTIGNFSSQAGLTVAIKGTTSAAPAIIVDTTSLDFGTVTVNQTKDLTLTVRNTGAATLNLNRISGTSQRFTPVGITVPITINAGSLQNLTFRFSPIASGPQTGSITITSNDPTRPSLSVNVTGTGGAAVPTITFGQTINGTLTTARRSIDCADCYAESYQLTVVQQRPYTFTLTSTAFDAYINVLDLSSKVLAWDDDGGGGTNARLFGTIQPGTYFIEVTTGLTNQTGAYTLAIAQ